MKRKHFLAAEIFGYSYAHYADHLGIGNMRFEQLMPQQIATLERAEHEGWDDTRLAKALEVAPEEVAAWRSSFRHAQAIVDAPHAAEAFRRGVRYSIEDAVKDGLSDAAAIERLVVQICFRAADMGYLLDQEEKRLSAYSEALRDETAIEDQAD
jgi:hypothetical protein